MDKIIGIVDGGSTKSDFVFVDNSGTEILRTQTMGFNPLFIEADTIAIELKKNQDLQNLAPQISDLYFYGAGSQSEVLQNRVEQGFSQVFSNAKITIDSDIKAAVYAAYSGEPTLVCILGTGSNSCFFNGNSIHKQTPSLGFILGDEGSGNHIGRTLLKNYFAQKFPEDLAIKFNEKYQISIDELLENVYRKPFANAYLASFSEFALQSLDQPYIFNLVKDCLQQFVEFQVIPYPQFPEYSVSFVGSIAHHYQKVLNEIALENNFTLGKIVARPIDDLVDYHLKYIFPNIQ